MDARWLGRSRGGWKRWMKTARRLAVGTLIGGGVVSSTGCITYDRVGPLFTPSNPPAEGFGLVYVYRPTKAWGASHAYAVSPDGNRTFVLFAGAYGVLVLPEGKATFAGNTSTIEVHPKHDKPIYIRAEFDSLVNSWNEYAGTNWKTEEVPEAQALAELGDIGLAPGGRGRYADDAVLPPSGTDPMPTASPSTAPPPAASSAPATAPSASTAPPPTSSSKPPIDDPTVDTIYLRDGTRVEGNIIAEDARAVSIVLKDGHGRPIPRDTIDRIVPKKKK